MRILALQSKLINSVDLLRGESSPVVTISKRSGASKISGWSRSAIWELEGGTGNQPAVRGKRCFSGKVRGKFWGLYPYLPKRAGAGPA